MKFIYQLVIISLFIVLHVLNNEFVFSKKNDIKRKSKDDSDVDLPSLDVDEDFDDDDEKVITNTRKVDKKVKNMKGKSHRKAKARKSRNRSKARKAGLHSRKSKNRPKKRRTKSKSSKKSQIISRTPQESSRSRKFQISSLKSKTNTTSEATTINPSLRRLLPTKPIDMEKYDEINRKLMVAYSEVFGPDLKLNQDNLSVTMMVKNRIIYPSMLEKPNWIEAFNSKPILKNIPGKTCFNSLGCFVADNYGKETLLKYSILPQTPESIDPKFILYTMDNKTTHHVFKYNASVEEIKNSTFEPKLKTIFIIHGYFDGYNESDSWQTNLRKSLMNKSIQTNYEVNIVVIDWSNASFALLYPISVANARVVSAMIAFFVNRIIDIFNVRYDSFHFIGHSLGAHICGWAAKYLKQKIGRITAFDPSGPLFVGKSPEDRLAITDANLVDVVHADNGAFGSKESIGHFDFYPHNGKKQPECESETMETKPKMVLLYILGLGPKHECGHYRSLELYQTYNDNQSMCQPVGYQCPDFDVFLEGRCSDCGKHGQKCRMFGYWPKYWDSIKPVGKPILYFKTGEKTNFCLFHYQIALHINETSMSENNHLDLKFEINGKNKTTLIEKTSHYLQPNNIHVFLYLNESIIGTADNMTFHWTASGDIDKNETIAIDYIEINHMSHSNKLIRDENSLFMCPSDSNTIPHNVTKKFVSCKHHKRMARNLPPNDLKSLA